MRRGGGTGPSSFRNTRSPNPDPGKIKRPRRDFARLRTSRAHGLSRFVGHGDEIEALESALERSLAGTGRVAAVVGEPGVGKSRLWRIAGTRAGKPPSAGLAPATRTERSP
ncbi:MAG: ATP-binding protein [Deltaproteobacteria bacterium]|nr:ATP-binding protein [Deltaproteobacteria bacterium]